LDYNHIAGQALPIYELFFIGNKENKYMETEARWLGFIFWNSYRELDVTCSLSCFPHGILARMT
jgi:hypothetical protein